MSRWFRAVAQVCIALGLTTFAAGCWNSIAEAELAPADGIVKINGQPAAGILVQFLPEVKKGQPGPTSTGLTNEMGEFELETIDGKLGAVVGPCKVLFVDTLEERVPQGQIANPPRIPSTLAVISSRTQEVEVKSENRRFEFNLAN